MCPPPSPRPARANRLFSGGSPGNPGEHPAPAPRTLTRASSSKPPRPARRTPKGPSPATDRVSGPANPGCLRGAPGCCGNGSARFPEWEDPSQPCVHATLRPQSSVSSRASQHLAASKPGSVCPRSFRSPFQSA
ncbi:hypothetical protein NN561_014093 [Cricetulus griseus]